MTRTKRNIISKKKNCKKKVDWRGSLRQAKNR